ncbi:3-hydroxyacyl-CoA dehydrogenase NAD-binding domain-containing protein [Sphingomonas glacialis]|uniref:L-gulonate 3-dehydrogenase n=1 Tax=Sphingomonas glacialis TaxID=658225 RepID=A0A502G5S0_9SPHN|nr:3-hydroxyacyl-CoA dehydrogenase NAD-binding domain-containing protein [Sphingomonas glacialis]TPG56546.1 hydroxylacyl-CoA dehydrogenase [Sphingomonas glacialis]
MPISSSDRPFAGKTAAIIGGGVIGASWAALFLVNSLKVIVSDPDPEVEPKVKAIVAAALPALEELGYNIADVERNLSFESDNSQAVIDAYLVQECGPEKPAFKQALWKAIEAAAPKNALLCSSSSTIPASVQFTEMTDQSRLVVGHPFNPPHLMPLVEVVPTPKTTPEVTAQALAFYNGIGKVAREIKKEITGFVANRLQAAIFRESVFLVSQGVVTLDELDDVVTNSLGIRWATSGPFLSFHLGGGPGGLTHFIEHLGPPMEAAWQHLGTAAFDDATKALLTEQLGRSYGTTSFYALSETRDAKEVAVINGLSAVEAAA